jgi:hypothetical protein
MMHLFKLVSAALLATAFTAAPALAQESATLKKAKDSGVDHPRPPRVLDSVLLL